MKILLAKNHHHHHQRFSPNLAFVVVDRFFWLMVKSIVGWLAEWLIGRSVGVCMSRHENQKIELKKIFWHFSIEIS